jgi:dTDP-4-amino-4,6-dideoxygalactose transaminase
MAVLNGALETGRRAAARCGTYTFATPPPPKDPILDGQAWFTDEQVEFILAQIPGVLRQGQLSNGPWTAEFETAVARRGGAKYATAFSSGPAAIEAVLTGLGVGPGDDVLVPAHSSIDNAMAVRLLGARPVFCDIAAETYSLEPEEIARKATRETKAVILVHAGGLITPDIAEIQGRCQAKGLALIEDCSQAHGARWHRKPAGSLGVAGVFSFHSTKVLTTGEGGAAVTSDRRLSRALRSLQNSGQDMEARTESYARCARTNRFPEISALMGLAQYRSLPQLVAARNATADYYRARLTEEAPGVAMQVHPGNIEHSYWKFLVAVPKGVARDQVKLFLQRHGIPASLCCYPPLHRQSLFGDLCVAEAAHCPVADDILERTLGLPTDPRISASQRQKVVDVFLEALQQDEAQRAS